MNRNTLMLRDVAKYADTSSSPRCDACGEAVTDMAAHVTACLDHELRMFSVGRRAN